MTKSRSTLQIKRAIGKSSRGWGANRLARSTLRSPHKTARPYSRGKCGYTSARYENSAGGRGSERRRSGSIPSQRKRRGDEEGDLDRAMPLVNAVTSFTGTLPTTLVHNNSTAHSTLCGSSVKTVPPDRVVQPREGASEVSQPAPPIKCSTDSEDGKSSPLPAATCERCGPPEGSAADFHHQPAITASDTPTLPTAAPRDALDTCSKSLQLPFASFKVSSFNFPSLARLLPQPQSLPTGSSRVNSASTADRESYTAVGSVLAATSSSARLALSGQPPPYFVLNPDLFEDTSVWTVRRLRQLCSSLHLKAPSGERGDIVQLLKNFHRNNLQADKQVPKADNMSVYREHSNFLLVPVATIDYPPARGREGAGEDAVSACTVKSILKHKAQEQPTPPAHGTRWAARLRMEIHEKRSDIAEVARPGGRTDTRDIQDSAGEGTWQHRRPQERKRLHINFHGEDDTLVNPACKKRIGFSAFNNVQLIDARAVDPAGTAVPAYSNIVTGFHLLQRPQTIYSPTMYTSWEP